jgi:hypothetical protein
MLMAHCFVCVFFNATHMASTSLIIVGTIPCCVQFILIFFYLKYYSHIVFLHNFLQFPSLHDGYG